jgi:hypothetical protein
MVQALPTPEVVRCYFDHAFDPHLPAMHLSWGQTGRPERLWELPEGVCLVGPAPQHFGVSIQRQGQDAYAVRLLWDRTCLNWLSLTRVQLLTSALAPLLGALGTDLWHLLDQPVAGYTTPAGVDGRRAA